MGLTWCSRWGEFQHTLSEWLVLLLVVTIMGSCPCVDTMGVPVGGVFIWSVWSNNHQGFWGQGATVHWICFVWLGLWPKRIAFPWILSDVSSLCHWRCLQHYCCHSVLVLVVVCGLILQEWGVLLFLLCSSGKGHQAQLQLLMLRQILVCHRKEIGSVQFDGLVCFRYWSKEIMAGYSAACTCFR